MMNVTKDLCEFVHNNKFTDLDDFAKKATDKEIAGFIKGVNKVALKLEITMDNGNGYWDLANIAELGAQEVPHLHFHLFGGEKIGKMVQ